jgi:hypothetical protein
LKWPPTLLPSPRWNNHLFHDVKTVFLLLGFSETRISPRTCMAPLHEVDRAPLAMLPQVL